MRVISLSLAVVLILLICADSRMAWPTPAQVPVQTAPTRSRAVKRMLKETDLRTSTEERWLAEFLKLPPKERLRLWLKASDWDSDVRDALIIQGQDTVQHLADLVYKGGADARKRALKLLCAIDRFVANEDMLLPEAGNEIYVKPLRKGGRLNPFMIVDGRRIGKVGLDAVLWATEQTQDDNLRFHARYSSGLLAQDLRKLALEEQLREWRKAVNDSKGSEGLFSNFKAHTLMIELNTLLVEQAPESLPPLIEMLKSDKSRYVRQEAVGLFASIDSYRMRLRATEIGRRAIEAIRLAYERDDLRPLESREQAWKSYTDIFFDDKIAFHNFSNWAVVALAFERFYGEQTVHRYYTVQKIIAPKPEMQQFVTYLTKVDPYFPGWEYVYPKFLSQDEVFHPRFKAKMARYHEYWKRFKAGEPPKPTTP